MSDASPNNLGRIVWHDLTAPDAPRLREFYEKVMGWSNMPIPMKDKHGEYADFVMLAPEGSLPPIVPPEHARGVCGVCHARGSNANIPPQWLIYVQVASVAASIAAAEALGGKLATPKRAMGQSVFCVLQDPAGAHIAIIGPD